MGKHVTRKEHIINSLTEEIPCCDMTFILERPVKSCRSHRLGNQENMADQGQLAKKSPIRP